jgi:hypothetical protein
MRPAHPGPVGPVIPLRLVSLPAFARLSGFVNLPAVAAFSSLVSLRVLFSFRTVISFRAVASFHAVISCRRALNFRTALRFRAVVGSAPPAGPLWLLRPVPIPLGRGVAGR